MNFYKKHWYNWLGKDIVDGDTGGGVAPTDPVDPVEPTNLWVGADDFSTFVPLANTWALVTTEYSIKASSKPVSGTFGFKQAVGATTIELNVNYILSFTVIDTNSTMISVGLNNGTRTLSIVSNKPMNVGSTLTIPFKVTNNIYTGSACTFEITSIADSRKNFTLIDLKLTKQ